MGQEVVVLASIITALVALITYGVRLILRGQLVPRVTVEKNIESWQKYAEELKTSAAEWKASYEKERETSRLALQQSMQLLEVTVTAEKVLKSLPLPSSTTEAG